MVLNLWLYLRYWCNEVHFLPATITFDRLYMHSAKCGMSMAMWLCTVQPLRQGGYGTACVRDAPWLPFPQRPNVLANLPPELALSFQLTSPSSSGVHVSQHILLDCRKASSPDKYFSTARRPVQEQCILQHCAGTGVFKAGIQYQIARWLFFQTL